MDCLSVILLLLNLFLSCNAAVLSTPVTIIPVTTALSASSSYTTAATGSSITGLLSSVTPIFPTATATECIPATIVTEGYSVFGYETAVPSLEDSNYYPAQGFFDSWFIGGNTMYFPMSDRARAEWKCQYSCGSRCSAFFVFWNFIDDNVGFWNCWTFGQSFARPNLVSAAGENQRLGVAFNKGCVDAVLPSSTITDSSPTTSSTCIPTSVLTDAYILRGYTPARPSPGLSDYYLDQAWHDAHFISESDIYVSIAERGYVEYICQYQCEGTDTCVAFIVTWETESGETAHWTCEIFVDIITPADLIPAPPNKTLGAAFEKSCPTPAV